MWHLQKFDGKTNELVAEFDYKNISVALGGIEETWSCVTYEYPSEDKIIVKVWKTLVLYPFTKPEYIFEFTEQGSGTTTSNV